MAGRPDRVCWVSRLAKQVNARKSRYRCIQGSAWAGCGVRRHACSLHRLKYAMPCLPKCSHQRGVGQVPRAQMGLPNGRLLRAWWSSHVANCKRWARWLFSPGLARLHGVHGGIDYPCKRLGHLKTAHPAEFCRTCMMHPYFLGPLGLIFAHARTHIHTHMHARTHTHA